MRLPTKHRCKVKKICQKQNFSRTVLHLEMQQLSLRIKHAPEFSTLTIQPWPIVEPGKEFNITGILVDKITLQPIANSDISFLYESASQAISPSSLEAIDKQSADTGGKFNAKTNAPDSQGIVSVTAVYNGSGLYHSVASDPALVIVSNSSLPP